MMVAAMLMLTATTVKAADITVTGEDRAALVAAFDEAQNGDVIILTKSISIGEDQFTITKGVTLRGGDGIEIKPAAGYTSRVLQVQPGDDAGVKLVFENITFRDANNLGNATGNEKDGGLGRIANGLIEFNNCKFINNYSDDRGGVWDMYGGNVTFNNCEFRGNSAAERGGAIFTRDDGTKATFVNSKFIGNHVNTGRGGALFLDNKSEQHFYNCVLTENFVGQIIDETDWEKNTGEGGAVFTTGGEGVLYVENSAIYKNYTLKDHGGVLFGMSKPTVTFVNTTIADNIMYRDANSMFFCTDAIKLNLINTTVVSNNAYVGKEGDPKGKNGPNEGNTTGIRIENKDAKLIIHNSIIAGNLSRGNDANAGFLVPVDINLQGLAANEENIVNILELKNSIVGNIKGLTKNALSGVPGIETSYYDFYTNVSTWQDADTKTGINWATGLKTLENGQAFYPVIGASSAIGLGDPALLSAYITPLVDQIGTPREGTKITSGAIEYVKGDSPLPLDGVNRIWGGTAENPCSYDAFTHTISYSGGWSSNVGWQFGSVEPLDQTSEDWSAYGKVVIKFAAPLPTGVALHIQYLDADGNLTTAKKEDGGELDAFVGGGSTEVSFALDKTLRNKVKSVYFSIQNDCAECTTGTIVLKDAYLLEEGYVLPFSINELNFFDGATYDEATHTATYNNGWSRVGWNWEADGGISASDFNQAWVKFDALGLPASGEGEHRGKLQFDLVYMDGTSESTGGGGFDGKNEYRAADTAAFWTLSHPEKKIKLITLKSEVTGNVILKDAYFYLKPVDPYDLIVTEVRWEPVNPAPGDSVTFFAKIANIGEFASEVNNKHGVVFQANGTQVSWADGFLGPLAAGDTIELSSRGEGSSGPLWATGTAPVYAIKAWVNDSKNLLETNYDNNTLIDTLHQTGSADLWIEAITTTPKTPIQGDYITFKATVRNIGTLDTPNNVKHGVAFFVNDQVVSWSDTRYDAIVADPDTTKSAVVLSANGGPNAALEGEWQAAFGGDYTIKAYVNDQSDIAETNRDNNILTVLLVIPKNGINDLNTAGNVYVRGSQLVIEGYSSEAALEVYNFSGQKVAGVKAVKGNAIALPAGTYVVKVQDNGKVGTHKVLVK